MSYLHEILWGRTRDEEHVGAPPSGLLHELRRGDYAVPPTSALDTFFQRFLGRRARAELHRRRLNREQRRIQRRLANPRYFATADRGDDVTCR